MAKKKHRKRQHFNPSIKDLHHLLYQNRHWNLPWEKRLRNHEYCKMYIPRDTLHRMIHEHIGDVPAPGDQACKVAYEAINSWLDAGFASYNDDLPTRLENLRICFAAKYPATAEALEKQKQIVLAFYAEPP